MLSYYEIQNLFALNYFLDSKSNLSNFSCELIQQIGENYKLKLRSNFYAIALFNYEKIGLNEKVFELALLLNNNERFNSLKLNDSINIVYEFLDILQLDYYFLFRNELTLNFFKNLGIESLLNYFVEADVFLREKKYYLSGVYPGTKFSNFETEYNFSFIFYTSKHHLSFGKQKGKTIEEVLQIEPRLIIFYLNNLKHFVLNYEVLLNPFLIKYLKDNYFKFFSLAILKMQIASNIINFDEALEYCSNENDNEAEKARRESAELGYNTFYEYFPEDFDEGYNY